MIAGYFVLVPMVLSIWPGNSAPLSEREPYAPNELIVKFKSIVPSARIEEINRRRGMTEVAARACGGSRLLRLPAAADLHAAIIEYSAMPEVEYAEPDYYYYAATNDPYYGYQWNLWNPEAGINIESAWAVTSGDPSVVVAVVDSGVAYENYLTFIKAPDLAGTYFVQGRNFVANPDTYHANDDYGHGTFVTGVIAQTTNNAIGCAGAAPGCSIMPVKVLGSTGSGRSYNVASGIRWAADNGAKVINLSIRSIYPSTEIRDALEYAYNHNVTVVAAAGNSYLDGNPTIYPAAYDDFCIAVGATRPDRTRSYYSSTGSYLDVVAPGGDTRYDLNGDGLVDGILQETFTNLGVWSSFTIQNWEGTSCASPHVAAIAGMLYSLGVDNPDRVREAIEKTARDLGPAGWDQAYGWGLVDAGAALRYYSSRGDLNGDGAVDYTDLWIICSHWLENYPAVDVAPVGGDGIVNFIDLTILAYNWGKQF